MLDILREEITEENKALDPFLPHILAVLNKAVVTVKACKADVRAELSKMEEKESIAPGKKHELQPRFHQTTKKGNKRKGQILR